MTRLLATLTLCLVTLQASAQQLPTRIRSIREAAAWSRVEQLYPGQPITLLQPGANRRYECDLDRVDDTVLTCIPFGGFGPPQRVVFARTQIARIWITEQVSGPSDRAFAIAGAIGAMLGGIVGSAAGVGGIFAGMAIGALIAAGFVGHSFAGESTRQVLLYKAH
jgi:hypothetical protein